MPELRPGMRGRCTCPLAGEYEWIVWKCDGVDHATWYPLRDDHPTRAHQHALHCAIVPFF